MFYKQRNFLLLAKTGFGKSLIFWLLIFIFESTSIVIIFIPLKLFQAKQNAIINYISNRKTILLTSNNNPKAIQQFITCKNYTHIFTSPKIALLKNIKAHILDHPYFVRYFSHLTNDEIYLVEE